MDWNFAGKNLTNAKFGSSYAGGGSTLTNADFTGANIHGASFYYSIGFTRAQLYSTSSYQAGDLTGIDLTDNDTRGWDFAGKNLTNADFENTKLANADFTGSEIRGAQFWNYFNTGISAAQLYSTASYQSDNLKGIRFGPNNLTGWNLSGKNLARSTFQSTNLTNSDMSDSDFASTSWKYNFWGASLTNTDLSNTRLTYAYFYEASLSNTILNRADARSARFLNTSSASIHNLIHPDGHVDGLDVVAGETIRLWDYNYSTPLPILVKDAMSVASTGTLQAVFEDDAWGSTITFDPGIGVTLGGTLELSVDSREGSNISSLAGTMFDLFDWAGVSPTGTFAQITTDAGLAWDTSNLYTTGDITLLSVPSSLLADFDDNGIVDEADLLTWRSSYGSTTDLDADGNGNGIVDAADYTVWRDNLGAGTTVSVPEPGAATLLLASLWCCLQPSRQS